MVIHEQSIDNKNLQIIFFFLKCNNMQQQTQYSNNRQGGIFVIFFCSIVVEVFIFIKRWDNNKINKNLFLFQIFFFICVSHNFFFLVGIYIVQRHLIIKLLFKISGGIFFLYNELFVSIQKCFVGGRAGNCKKHILTRIFY